MNVQVHGNIGQTYRSEIFCIPQLWWWCPFCVSILVGIYLRKVLQPTKNVWESRWSCQKWYYFWSQMKSWEDVYCRNVGFWKNFSWYSFGSDLVLLVSGDLQRVWGLIWKPLILLETTFENIQFFWKNHEIFFFPFLETVLAR